MAIGIDSYKQNLVQQSVVTKPAETKPNPESKMDTTSKVAIGTGLAALAAVGIYIATKGKGSSAEKISKIIEFKPSTTIAEAKAFAKTHLGIKHYDLTNVEIANHINEGLVNLHNSVKGKKMFDKVKTFPSNSVVRMSCSFDGKVLSVNEKEILESMKLENLQSLFNRVSTECNISHFDLNQKQQELIAKFKVSPSKLSFNEKMEFEELIAKIEVAPKNYLKRYTEAMKNDAVFNSMKKNNRIMKSDDFLALQEEQQAKYIQELFNAGYKQPIYARGPFCAVNHEFGHKLHSENIGEANFAKMTVNVHCNPEIAQKNINEYFINFIKREPGAYSILCEVSGYAPFSESEAVAEIFAGLQNGVKYNEKTLSLFDKWGGVRA